jgi:hypothetical protein
MPQYPELAKPTVFDVLLETATFIEMGRADDSGVASALRDSVVPSMGDHPVKLLAFRLLPWKARLLINSA